MCLPVFLFPHFNIYYYSYYYYYYLYYYYYYYYCYYYYYFSNPLVQMARSAPFHIPKVVPTCLLWLVLPVELEGYTKRMEAHYRPLFASSVKTHWYQLTLTIPHRLKMFGRTSGPSSKLNMDDEYSLQKAKTTSFSGNFRLLICQYVYSRRRTRWTWVVVTQSFMRYAIV